MKTDEGKLNAKTTRDIKQSLEDLRTGRTLSMQEVKKRLKIK